MNAFVTCVFLLLQVLVNVDNALTVKDQTVECKNGERIIPIHVSYDGTRQSPSNDPCLESIRILFIKSCWGKISCVFAPIPACEGKIVFKNYECVPENAIKDICNENPTFDAGISKFYVTNPLYPNFKTKFNCQKRFTLPIEDDMTFKITLLDIEMFSYMDVCQDKLTFIYFDNSNTINYKLCGNMTNLSDKKFPQELYFNTKGGQFRYYSGDFDKQQRGFALQIEVISTRITNYETTLANIKTTRTSSSSSTMSTLFVIVICSLLSYIRII